MVAGQQLWSTCLVNGKGRGVAMDPNVLNPFNGTGIPLGYGDIEGDYFELRVETGWWTASAPPPHACPYLSYRPSLPKSS